MHTQAAALMYPGNCQQQQNINIFLILKCHSRRSMVQTNYNIFTCLLVIVKKVIIFLALSEEIHYHLHLLCYNSGLYCATEACSSTTVNNNLSKSHSKINEQPDKIQNVKEQSEADHLVLELQGMNSLSIRHLRWEKAAPELIISRMPRVCKAVGVDSARTGDEKKQSSTNMNWSIWIDL